MQSLFNSNAHLSFKQIAVIILTLIWYYGTKGPALWRSAKRGQMIWFIVMLLVHTFGVLELAYLFIFSQERPQSKIKEFYKKIFRK
jgi:hypothetical protein